MKTMSFRFFRFFIGVFYFLFSTSFIVAQGVLPINRYQFKIGPLDKTNQSSTLAYSFRRISKRYSGFALKIRRNSDNAEANVSFDAIGNVSNTSNVTVSAVGSSGLSVGQVLNFAAFKGSARLFVTTWYNQGATAYHATQTINANQPELLLNTAGATGSLPSLFFAGSHFLVINQPIQNIVSNGINGSFLLAAKPTQNTAQESFGHWKTTWTAINHWRWSFHINWSDGYTYFDAAENCCAANRSFDNNANLNLWKQYSFVRGTAYKTVRISTSATALNNSSAPSVASSGGAFNIGWATNALDPGFYGYLAELIMFPVDLNNSQLLPIENDQIAFWGL